MRAQHSELKIPTCDVTPKPAALKNKKRNAALSPNDHVFATTLPYTRTQRLDQSAAPDLHQLFWVERSVVCETIESILDFSYLPCFLEETDRTRSASMPSNFAAIPWLSKSSTLRVPFDGSLVNERNTSGFVSGSGY